MVGITPEKLAEANTEHSHQAALFCWCAQMALAEPEKYGLLQRCYFSIPNGGERNIKVATKMVAEGAKKGVSDTMLAAARGPYHGMFLEMKKPGKGSNESKEQKEFGAAVREQGYFYTVCDHWALATHLIVWYLNGCIGDPPKTILGD